MYSRSRQTPPSHKHAFTRFFRAALWSDRVHLNYGQHLDRLSLCTQARIFFERSNVCTQACILHLELFVLFLQSCHADPFHAGFHWVTLRSGGLLLEQLRFHRVVFFTPTRTFALRCLPLVQNVLPNPRRTSAALPRAELALHEGVDIVVLVQDDHALPFEAAAVGCRTLALCSLAVFCGAASTVSPTASSSAMSSSSPSCLHRRRSPGHGHTARSAIRAHPKGGGAW